MSHELDDAETLGILTAVYRLRRFSANEVAAHSGVAVAAVRDCLGSCEWVEPAGEDERGSPTALWRLRAEKCAELVGLLDAAHLRATAAPTQTHSQTEPRAQADAMDILDMLQATLDFAETGAPDEAALVEEIDTARTYLGCVEAESWDLQVRSDQAARARQQLISSFHARLRTLRAGSGAAVSAAPELQGSARRLRAALDDWQIPIPRKLQAEDPVPSLAVSSTSALERAATLLKGIYGSAPDAESAAFVPALRALALRGDVEAGASSVAAAAEAWASVRAAALAESRRMLASPWSARLLAPIALLAVVLDAPELADPIFEAFLNIESGDRSMESSRRLCLSAFSRLAESAARQGAGNGAACACLFLVSRFRRAEDLPILVPAAVCLDEADVKMLLRRVAEAMYDGTGISERYRAMVDEGSFMRTLTVSLFLRDDVSTLGAHIADMLTKLDGKAFISALVDPSHRAMLLLDGDDETYTLRPNQPSPAARSHHESIDIAIDGDSDEAELMARLRLGQANRLPLGRPQPLTDMLRRRASPGSLS